MGDALKNFERLKDSELARWARAILDAQRGVDDVPKGFYTDRQLAEKFGFSIAGIRSHIMELKEKGLVIEKKFQIWNKTRRYSLKHYKLKKFSK